MSSYHRPVRGDVIDGESAGLVGNTRHHTRTSGEPQTHHLIAASRSEEQSQREEQFDANLTVASRMKCTKSDDFVVQKLRVKALALNTF